MKRVLLMVVILGAAVAANADTIPIGIARSGISADPGQTNSLVSTVTIASHAGRDLHTQNSLIVMHEKRKHVPHDGGRNDPTRRIDPTPDPTPVPEPATILMLGTGLCGVIGAARRKLQR